MATAKTASVDTQANNVNIMNAMRANMSLQYQDRIPLATQENINGLYETILNYQGVRNEFVDSLINLVLLQRVETVYFRNPLNELKQDPMRYGDTEEEIFVNMAKGYEFDPWADANKLFGYYDANVMAAYHKINHNEQYAVTVTFDQLRTAFASKFGIRSLINAKTESLVSGEQYDEYLCMKKLVESAYASEQIFPVQISEPVNEGTAKNLVMAVRSYAAHMRFPEPAFNIAGATSAANDSSIYAMLTPEMDALLDVEVLAYAFNMDKADVNLHKIVVDKFNNDAIKMFIFDRRWFKVRDQYKLFTSNNGNGASLTWNYFYTVAEMFSYSPFFPGIVFTTDKFAVDSITAEFTGTAKPGDTIEITALASATSGKAVQYLDFEVSGNTSARTHFIPGTNRLVIGRDEKAASLTVTVTSRYTGYYGTTLTANCTVTVTQ